MRRLNLELHSQQPIVGRLYTAALGRPRRPRRLCRGAAQGAAAKQGRDRPARLRPCASSVAQPPLISFPFDVPPRATRQSGQCKLDVQNKLGDTPLHNAAWKGSPEVRACGRWEGWASLLAASAGPPAQRVPRTPIAGGDNAAGGQGRQECAQQHRPNALRALKRPRDGKVLFSDPHCPPFIANQRRRPSASAGVLASLYHRPHRHHHHFFLSVRLLQARGKVSHEDYGDSDDDED